MGWKHLVLVMFVGAVGCDDSTSDAGTDGGSGSSSAATTSSTDAADTSATADASSATSDTPGTTTISSGTSSSTSGDDSSSDGGSTTTADACGNGIQDDGEADVDCGGDCDACPTGSRCVVPKDCASQTCETGSCLGPADGCNPDEVQSAPGGMSWADSYSVDGRCYCASTFDHNIADIEVDTPAGPRTVLEVCEAIGPGPGIEGNPIYNDIQCGNGPANDAGDEDWCPGRVDQGETGCCIAGPTWDLSVFER